MAEKRYSVMVLPFSKGKILLQSFENKGETVWDGFGSFYSNSDSPEATAQKVFADKFKQNIRPEDLIVRANLQYLISKPSGLVDLEITIYFANVADTSLGGDNLKWFDDSNIPYEQMHIATGKWLPVILKRPELLKAIVRVDQPGDHTKGAVTEFATQ